MVTAIDQRPAAGQRALHRRSAGPRRRTGALSAAVVLLLAGTGAAHATTGPTDDQISDAEERVQQLDDDLFESETRTEALDQRLEQLDRRLATAAQQLTDADTRAARAQREAAEATAEVERTETALADAEAALVENRERLADVARDAWMHGGTTSSPALAAANTLTSGADIDDAADAMHLLGIVIRGRSVAVEDTQVLVARTEQLRRTVRAAQQTAEARSDEAQRALDDAAQRNAEVLALVDEVETSMRQEQRQATELESERSAAAQDLEGLQQAREDAIAAADAAVESRTAFDGFVSVGGITVAASLAPALEDMLEAAYADGIELSGYGYRSPETTARLRRANGCPDVYESPASACRVPTARPGESMHEQGLAIDFNYRGGTVCYPRSASSCTGNPAFDWLAANAARYGLQVLSTEAWHWSTNGE